jgi:hypothetical protein
MIHPSHSRSELIEIVEVFELDVEDYTSVSKQVLSKRLWEYLKVIDFVEKDDEVFFIDNVNDLKEYLIKSSPRQIISEKDKLKILDKCRNIVFYAKHTGYFLSGSNYKTIEAVQEDAKFLSNFGDKSSVRRALRYYNADMSNPVKIQPVITRKTQKRLDRIDKIKKETTPAFRLGKGKFLVEFL